MLAISGVEGEHDAGTVPFDEAVAIMRKAGVRCIVYNHVPEAVAAGNEGTDPDAWVAFKFNDTVLEVHANNTAFDGHANEYLTFDVTFKGVGGQDSFFIMSHGTANDNQGMLIDSITVHDWII